jgi:Tfp pilus assembly PilM family ATPase
MWRDAWDKGLEPLDRALRGALDRLGVQGRCRATVFHHGPDVITEVFSYPTGVSGAMEAARLALAETLPYPMDCNPHVVKLLARDKGGQTRRAHVLVSADKDESAQCLHDWVERAGCVVEALASRDAAVLSAVIKRVMGGTSNLAVMYLGEHRTVIAAGEAGSLRFVRVAGVGYDLLVDAYARAKPASSEGGPVLSRAESRELLLSVGIPMRRGVVHESSGLASQDVLPLLQPIIQRYAVEAKQSMRFGLGETESARTKLVMAGPGAAIPQLAEVLAGHVDLEIEPCQTWSNPQQDAGGGGGCRELYRTITGDASNISLMPHAAEEHRASRLVQRCLGVGAVAAMVAMGADAMMTMSALREAQHELSVTQPRITQIMENNQTMAKAAVLAGRVLSAQSQLDSVIGSKPSWRALLGALSELTDDTVRLTEVRCDLRNGKPAAVLRGMTSAEQSDQSGILAQYMERLLGCPLVKDVDLGSTRTMDTEEGSRLQFELTISLNSLPVKTLVEGDVP